MTTDRANDLRAFRGFIDAQLNAGGDELTLAEALARWDFENQTEDERAETAEAIARGLADVDAGRVRPAREAIDEVRRRHGLPPLP